MLPTNKIISREEAHQIAEQLHEAKQPIVFTNGCFDLLHRGHIELLHFAKEQGKVLFVGLNSDSSVQRLKGTRRPINSQDDRAAILAAIEYVDYVVIFYEDTPFELIAVIQPDVLVKGGDYEPHEIVGRDIVEGRGGKVLVFPLINGFSSTQLLKKLMNNF